MIHTLKQALTSFNGIGLDECQLTAKFKEIAKSAIYSGHFLVNETMKIRIIEVEFYFHSEDSVKTKVFDWGMYHIGKNVDYFQIGSLHPHNSGIDVTFERENCYRASFLIRKYKVEGETGIIDKPTYLREDLFGYTGCICGDGPKIEWINDDIDIFDTELIQTSRINLTAFNDDESIKYDKNGKKIKDKRNWRFARK